MRAWWLNEVPIYWVTSEVCLMLSSDLVPYSIQVSAGRRYPNRSGVVALTLKMKTSEMLEPGKVVKLQVTSKGAPAARRRSLAPTRPPSGTRLSGPLVAPRLGTHQTNRRLPLGNIAHPPPRSFRPLRTGAHNLATAA
jgi:hypothetical protein